MTRPITRFRDEYDFLSNFHPSPVEIDGVEYPTVEHAYQAAKTNDPARREKIAAIATPSAAKVAGRRIKRPANWFDINLDIMESLVRQKFTRYPDLADKLLATGDAELIEGNTWNDRFFGRVWDKKKREWVGENKLGQMLMRVREEISQ